MLEFYEKTSLVEKAKKNISRAIGKLLKGETLPEKKPEHILHFLVPRHEIASKEESEAVLKELGTSLDKMPKILKEDPIVENLNAQKNDIIKIYRDSKTAGKIIYYRVVK